MLSFRKLIGGTSRSVGSNVSPDVRTPGAGEGRRDLPRPRHLEQRRFIPMPDRRCFWVDDDGHEPEHHIENEDGSFQFSKWHRFEDYRGRLIAIRCPVSLDEAEHARIEFDIPEGIIGRVLYRYDVEHSQRHRNEDKTADSFKPAG